MFISQIIHGKLGFGEFPDTDSIILVFDRDKEKISTSEATFLEVDSSPEAEDRVVFIGKNLLKRIDIPQLMDSEMEKLLKRLKHAKFKLTLVTSASVPIDYELINKYFSEVIVIFSYIDVDPHSIYNDRRIKELKNIENINFAFLIPNPFVDLQIMGLIQDFKINNYPIYLIPDGRSEKEIHRVYHEVQTIYDLIKSSPVKNLFISREKTIGDIFPSV
jgi:hypothetical protein